MSIIISKAVHRAQKDIVDPPMSYLGPAGLLSIFGYVPPGDKVLGCER